MRLGQGSPLAKIRGPLAQKGVAMQSNRLATMAGMGLVAGAFILQAVPANAQTVPVTYTYVFFGSGPHHRQPRTVSGSGFTTLSSQPGGQWSTGQQQAPVFLPPTLTVGPQSYQFAFSTVVGGAALPGGCPAGTPAGSTTSLDPLNPCKVTVGTQPITVLAVYVPAGGGNGPPDGGSGATIDSFDETTGSLFNDTFVSVSPDLGGTLTKSGNVDGYVDTTNSTETITALSPTSPTNVDFSRWVALAPPTFTSDGAALPVRKGQSVIALAFYQSRHPPICAATVASVQQIIEHCAPLLTVSQWQNVEATLRTCVLEHQLTQAFVTSLENQYTQTVKTCHQPPPPRPGVHP